MEVLSRNFLDSRYDRCDRYLDEIKKEKKKKRKKELNVERFLVGCPFKVNIHFPFKWHALCSMDAKLGEFRVFVYETSFCIFCV